LGQTRVDLQHLLEDIRDAYPGAIEETILTEMVANSLDSGAKLIHVQCDPAAANLIVVDDGSGMARRELARYHDVAASAKIRGEGIGFAGVGIKLGLLASEEVVTETRRGKVHVATSWRLASRHKAPWRWVQPAGLVPEHGTAVRLHLRNPLSPLVEPGYVETTLRHHFEPLFDVAFDELLASHYAEGVRFVVNGRELARSGATGNPRVPISIRLSRQRKPSAAGYLLLSTAPLAEDQQGVAVSTLGKVIKRGWDWLGLTPSVPDHVAGLVDVPGLAQSLTLNKADFIRVGARGAVYLAYRKALQEVVAAQLTSWGEYRDSLAEDARRRKTRPLERDLAEVLIGMTEDFPLIASLVDRKPGGQTRLSMASPGGQGSGGLVAAHAFTEASRPHGPQEVQPETSVTSSAPSRSEASGELPEEEAAEPPKPAAHLLLPAPHGRRRRARLGLKIQFENRPDTTSLGRLVESTVWVNETHPAYRRAVASRSEGYHVALVVAMALSPLAVEPAENHAFITAFLGRWGELVVRPRVRRKTKTRRP
jgi:hypothetical protein